MGGERASTIRQREAGKICCICSNLLETPPPSWHRPGFRTGGRFCDNCAPRILVHVQAGDVFTVSFTKGPWLLFATLAEVKSVLAWAHVHCPDFDSAIRQWGRASCECRLDETQRYKLALRRRGWPWNGYELKKMWDAGTYPPARLTPAQERIFLANRKRNERRS